MYIETRCASTDINPRLISMYSYIDIMVIYLYLSIPYMYSVLRTYVDYSVCIL